MTKSAPAWIAKKPPASPAPTKWADLLEFRSIDPERDADWVVAHRRDSFVVSFGNEVGFAGREIYLAWLADRLRELPAGLVLAFDPAGPLGRERPVGQIESQIRANADHIHVNLYYVVAEVRGRGYGQQLHQYIEALARTHDLPAIQLKVSPTNAPALRFYERLGFQRLKVEPRGAGEVWILRKVV